MRPEGVCGQEVCDTTNTVKFTSYWWLKTLTV